ncbi:MAG: nitroreductase [Verrucomicrobiota bacterium]|jgi:nitroreductase|nr:nitroreductase [Verrucomicrobiota bacterium]
MEVTEAIRNRKSTRAFLDKPVPDEIVTEILECARWAPSGVNSQPWQVAVLTGKTKRQLGEALSKCRVDGVKANPDYRYYPSEIKEPYITRKRTCGHALYSALSIERNDIESRKAQWMKNYHGFGAPVLLFFFIDASLEKGSWVDMGMFIQNVMLATRGHGLETCPQAALAEYPDVVRKRLNIPGTNKLVCGMALGHANYDDPSYQYRTDREPVEEFAQWFS